jgi:hypothetical protein
MRQAPTRFAAPALLVAVVALAGSVAPGGGLAADATAAAAPNTYIHGGPFGTTRARSASFHLLATGGAVRIQCKLDRGRWYVCARSASRSVTLRNLRRGSHTFYARAVNRSGQVDRIPAKRTWRVR